MNLKFKAFKFQLGNAFKEYEKSLPPKKKMKGLDILTVMEIVENSCAEDKYNG